MTDDVILSKTDDGQVEPDVWFENETVWSTRTQMKALFEGDFLSALKTLPKK